MLETGVKQKLDIKEILAQAIAGKASDIHINVGMKPIARRDTELLELDFPEVTQDIARQMVIDMAGEEKLRRLDDKKDVDFSTSIEGGYRFRVNAHYQKETIAISFRAVSSSIPNIEALHLPEVASELIDLPRGLILVTGHTGSGKSTTLASMLNSINRKYRKRIITLEDPIEYMLHNQKSMIEQREIGGDCPEFASGLRHVLRQDPDIIMVGEMRDLETTGSTITAAETGHLVFSTLHTINASQTIDRIIDIYPSSQQGQIRSMLANSLQAVISQTLFRRIDKEGMVPCTEILLCTSAVRNCIRENRIHEIPNLIETSRRLGMQSMDWSIQQMCEQGYISREEAVLKSNNPAKMDKVLSK